MSSASTVAASSPVKSSESKFKMPAIMIKPAAVVRWIFPPILGIGFICLRLGGVKPF
jgi:hypothetical protein